MRRYFALLLMLPVAGLLASCQNDDPTKPSPPVVEGIKFLNPVNGSVIPAEPMTIRVKTEGIILDCANVGGTNQDGHGHWHLYLDGTYLDLSCTETLDIDFTSVAPGQHTLVASLRQNDHKPYDHHSGADPYNPYIQLDNDDIISVMVE